jgi:pilus assembly protein CpaF
MRPDRLIVGEARGAEAFDLLQAMNTGHDGSLATCHANGVADAFRRLEALVLLAGTGLPAAAVRDQLCAAVDLVVHVARGPGGRRRVVEVAEPGELPGDDGRPIVRTLATSDGVVAGPRRRSRESP